MRPISRVYPIRQTAAAWKIRILAPHTCNERCAYSYIKTDCSDGSGVKYVPVENPEFKDGKCPDYGKLVRADVPLSSFDVNNPCTYRQIPLHGPDEIVIPDTRFNVIISYPIRDPTKITMFAPSERGFTRAELIGSLKAVYEFIYREEERTATPTIYEYSEKCSDCSNRGASSFLRGSALAGTCAICYANSKKEGCALPCGHKFHLGCVLPWAEKQNTCPLCRRYIRDCRTCSGSGFIFRQRSDVVIPIEHRGFWLNRNTTDGVFGIWGHDFEDLILEDLLYDHRSRVLHIFIGS